MDTLLRELGVHRHGEKAWWEGRKLGFEQELEADLELMTEAPGAISPRSPRDLRATSARSPCGLRAISVRSPCNLDAYTRTHTGTRTGSDAGTCAGTYTGAHTNSYTGA